MKPLHTESRAFTLAEVLVSILIFGLLCAMAYGGLHSILQTRKATEVSMDRLEQLQRFFLFMGRDFEQVVARTVRDEFGSTQPALRAQQVGDYRIELTRAGWRNPAKKKRSTLQRVAYRQEGEQLFRVYWPVLDRTEESKAQELLLLGGVKQFDLRYLDENENEHQQWPPQQRTGSKSSLPLLPSAIEVVFELDQWGEFRRIFILPN